KPQPKATAKSSGPRKAVLITKDPKAQVNVRTANNLQSDVIHAGISGDQVQIVKSQPGEGGYTWYQVKFPVAKVQGWVRGDFIKLGAQ
ncbi:MAG: SH3 domain-containing protein, partial [Cyanobacteria bacterium P01_A01_bin.17]